MIILIKKIFFNRQTILVFLQTEMQNKNKNIKLTYVNVLLLLFGAKCLNDDLLYRIGRPKQLNTSFYLVKLSRYIKMVEIH